MISSGQRVRRVAPTQPPITPPTTPPPPDTRTRGQKTADFACGQAFDKLNPNFGVTRRNRTPIRLSDQACNDRLKAVYDRLVKQIPDEDTDARIFFDTAYLVFEAQPQGNCMNKYVNKGMPDSEMKPYHKCLASFFAPNFKRPDGKDAFFWNGTYGTFEKKAEEMLLVALRLKGMETDDVDLPPELIRYIKDVEKMLGKDKAGAKFFENMIKWLFRQAMARIPAKERGVASLKVAPQIKRKVQTEYVEPYMDARTPEAKAAIKDNLMKLYVRAVDPLAPVYTVLFGELPNVLFDPVRLGLPLGTKLSPETKMEIRGLHGRAIDKFRWNKGKEEPPTSVAEKLVDAIKGLGAKTEDELLEKLPGVDVQDVEIGDDGKGNKPATKVVLGAREAAKALTQLLINLAAIGNDDATAARRFAIEFVWKQAMAKAGKKPNLKMMVASFTEQFENKKAPVEIAAHVVKSVTPDGRVVLDRLPDDIAHTVFRTSRKLAEQKFGDGWGQRGISFYLKAMKLFLKAQEKNPGVAAETLAKAVDVAGRALVDRYDSKDPTGEKGSYHYLGAEYGGYKDGKIILTDSGDGDGVTGPVGGPIKWELGKDTTITPSLSMTFGMAHGEFIGSVIGGAKLEHAPENGLYLGAELQGLWFRKGDLVQGVVKDGIDPTLDKEGTPSPSGLARWQRGYGIIGYTKTNKVDKWKTKIWAEAGPVIGTSPGGVGEEPVIDSDKDPANGYPSWTFPVSSIGAGAHLKFLYESGAVESGPNKDEPKFKLQAGALGSTGRVQYPYAGNHFGGFKGLGWVKAAFNTAHLSILLGAAYGQGKGNKPGADGAPAQKDALSATSFAAGGSLMGNISKDTRVGLAMRVTDYKNKNPLETPEILNITAGVKGEQTLKRWGKNKWHSLTLGALGSISHALKADKSVAGDPNEVGYCDNGPDGAVVPCPTDVKTVPTKGFVGAYLTWAFAKYLSASLVGGATVYKALDDGKMNYPLSAFILFNIPTP